MAMNDISALLAALKAKEGAAGEPDEAGLDGAPGQEDAPEDSPQDSAEDNAKIVDVLQQDYPQIYAKISAKIEAEDGSDAAEPAAPNGDEMGGMDKMAGLMA